MGIESMMRILMTQRNEKKEKQQKRTKSPASKDPNRAFLKEMVYNFFQSDDTLIKYEENDMTKLLDQLRDAVKREPTLLELESPTFVCGDIHGQLTDLRRIFYICGFPSRKRFLFLGDYVDRGSHSVEVVCVLAAWKLLFPNNVFLLRGNHELAHINKDYGFLDEVKSKWIDPAVGEKMYNKFNECFSFFPLAAVISEKILCMHGGLSPSLNSLNDIRKLDRPIRRPAPGLTQDMLWADPKHSVVGFGPNPMRAVGCTFGESEVRERLKKLGVSKMIRAHQVVQFGWEAFANGQVITVFSACRYQEDYCNYGAVIEIKKNLGISVNMIKPAEFDEMKPFADPLTVDRSAMKENEKEKKDQYEATMPSYRGKTGEDKDSPEKKENSR